MDIQSTFGGAVRFGRIAALACVLVAACTPSDKDVKTGSTAAVPVEDVREQVRQFALGGAEKDEAGERFYEWGDAAHPALAELTRDPTLTDEELATMVMIVAVYAHTPELFAALRTRIAAMPDAEARDMRLGMLQELESVPGIPRP
jgi:hypothetical protein